MQRDLFLAILMVAIVLFLFLHSARNSLIVLLSIPTSLITTFFFMYLLDYTLNLVSLMALALVIGILVDDSIVVLENIHRHLERGEDPDKAAVEGRSEIGFAAIAITLVDVVVFLPISLVGGVVGRIFSEFGITIVVSTLLSLFVSFTLTPMLAAKWSRLVDALTRANSRVGRFIAGFEGMQDRMGSGTGGPGLGARTTGRRSSRSAAACWWRVSLSSRWAYRHGVHDRFRPGRIRREHRHAARDHDRQDRSGDRASGEDRRRRCPRWSGISRPSGSSRASGRTPSSRTSARSR